MTMFYLAMPYSITELWQNRYETSKEGGFFGYCFFGERVQKADRVHQDIIEERRVLEGRGRESIMRRLCKKLSQCI
jgi:hypothetical protein